MLTPRQHREAATQRLLDLQKRGLATRINASLWTVIPEDNGKPTHPLDSRWRPKP